MTAATDPRAPANPLARLIATGAHQRLLAFASLVALLIGFSLASTNFMQTSNMIAILQAASVNGVLAIAATLVIVTGGIDLSVGTLMTFTAVITGVVLTHAGMPLPFGVVAAILTGAVCG
ncbi:MAG: ABC transporter permease, partial [Rubrimonas sp.]